MDLGKYAKLEDGKLIIDLGAVAKPVIESYKAKVLAGEVDPIKGTDLDKEVLIKALDAIIAQLS